MTVETKTTIQASDIVSVEFTHCHSVSSWPISVAKEPPMKCSCGRGQWMVYHGPEYENITALIDLLKQHGKATNPEFHHAIRTRGFRPLFR